MSHTGYLLLGYTVGLGLLLGDVVFVWLAGRMQARRQRAKGAAS